ncbi:TIGR03905 family TSCPD domain-containing protein [uncultured Slackia sp.]|uniref:TIGR03905 family TSCPD domain-containing protein n=1 Tax=uncultured Slackia sp. TaxID=665903 RepID=UPI0026E0C21F|nr:TIGR03905 family TSCPD domain-containing protein [uncultured Slackia sp.]
MYSYKTRGTCSRSIQFDVVDGTVRDVSFEGGCNGNLKGIGKLVEGMPADRVAELLEGTTCGPRATSCPDQLAQALKLAIEDQKDSVDN